MSLDPTLELPPRRSPGRVGRAAIFAFRALVIGSAGAAAGCGASSGLEVGFDGGVRSDAALVGSDGGTDAGTRPRADAGLIDAGTDAGGIIAAYGGPVPADAGIDASDPAPVPAYGTPPPPFEFDAGTWDAGSGVGNLYGAAPAD